MTGLKYTSSGLVYTSKGLSRAGVDTSCCCKTACLKMDFDISWNITPDLSTGTQVTVARLTGSVSGTQEQGFAAVDFGWPQEGCIFESVCIAVGIAATIAVDDPVAGTYKIYIPILQAFLLVYGYTWDEVEPSCRLPNTLFPGRGTNSYYPTADPHNDLLHLNNPPGSFGGLVCGDSVTVTFPVMPPISDGFPLAPLHPFPFAGVIVLFGTLTITVVCDPTSCPDGKIGNTACIPHAAPPIVPPPPPPSCPDETCVPPVDFDESVTVPFTFVGLNALFGVPGADGTFPFVFTGGGSSCQYSGGWVDSVGHSWGFTIFCIGGNWFASGGTSGGTTVSAVALSGTLQACCVPCGMTGTGVILGLPFTMTSGGCL